MKTVEVVSDIKIIKEEHSLEDVLKAAITKFAAFSLNDGRMFIHVYQEINLNLEGDGIDVIYEYEPTYTIGLFTLTDSTLLNENNQEKLREYALSNIDMFITGLEE